MQIEDVIFLGAGASKAEGASLQSTLFRDFLSTRFSQPRQLELQREVRDFLGAFFDVCHLERDPAEEEYPTFEEVLGILDLALLRGESFKGLSSTAQRPQVQSIRDNLVYSMAVLLDEQLGERAVHHRALVARLGREGKLQKTAFVSSNYDILIDDALIGAQREFGLDLSYGVEFTNFETGDIWSRPRSNKEVFLYKLHGSLNWLYCPSCVSLTLAPEEKPVARLSFEPRPCGHCGTFMTPIIVPPTYFKNLSNVYLQEIWLGAGRAVRQAKRWIFCGYSFPDADIFIKYLLKRAELDRGATPQVFVINRGKNWAKEGSEEASRYRRFFKESGRLQLTDLSFEEFARNGIVTR
jgi:hypothetical protein